MNCTLKKFTDESLLIPAITAVYLSDLAESRGRQELYTKQSPQRLKSLREHALIESAVSSNRIEGVNVDRSRVGTVIFGRSILNDRDEEEVRGYREALSLIHDKRDSLPVTEQTVKQLHSLSRAKAGDAGEYKKKNSDIIEKYPDGRERVRFRTTPAKETPEAMIQLITLWDDFRLNKTIPELVLLAAWNLDFLCVHPFRDGNGRVSRLILFQQLYHLGYEVGRYISLEKIIEETKDRYYETLELSSEGWHNGKNDPWPYINYILYTLKTACAQFESRFTLTNEPRGAKRRLVEEAISSMKNSFSVSDVMFKCPGVSIDTVRKIFKAKQKEGLIICVSQGRDAVWQKVESG